MLTPSASLLTSIAGMSILLRLKLHPGIAIFAGSIIISLLILPLSDTPSLLIQSLLNYQTLRLLVIIASALTLSGLMEQKGLLSQLAETLEKIAPKLAVHLIPAVIGFVPMPAGALVSATASRDSLKRLGITPEQSTFINYWFRHLWEFSMPVYPSIIATSVILAVPLSYVVMTLLPGTFLAIITGAAISYTILKKIPGTKGGPSQNIIYNLLKACWPILLLVLSILLGLDAMVAFPLVFLLLAMQQRARRPELAKALKYGLDPKIMFFLYAVMLYKTTIESANVAGAVFSDMQTVGLPIVVILTALPFLIAFITGNSMAFVGITFPLLVPYIILPTGISSYALLLAYTSGIAGLLLTPLHLCLILSAEYFKASLAKIYKYLLLPSTAIEAVVILLYYIAV